MLRLFYFVYIHKKRHINVAGIDNLHANGKMHKKK